MRTTDSSAGEQDRIRAYRDSVAEPIERPFAEALAGRALLAAGHRALEVPCGSGLLARRIAPVVGTGGSVTGVDDAAWLELARAADDGIVWMEGDGCALPFEAKSFDAVLSCLGASRLGDPAAALGEIPRVLRLGGRVALAVWSAPERNPFFRAVIRAFERCLSDEGEAARRALAAYERSFEHGDAERLKQRLEEAGFLMVSVEESRLDLELPAPAAFLPAYLHATGLGQALGETEAPERQGRTAAFNRAFLTELEGDEGVSPEGMRLPFRSLFAFGRAWRV